MTDDEDDWPPDPMAIDFKSGEWITPQQAADLMCVTVKTIRRWIADKDISVAVPSGRRWINRRRLIDLMT